MRSSGCALCRSSGEGKEGVGAPSPHTSDVNCSVADVRQRPNTLRTVRTTPTKVKRNNIARNMMVPWPSFRIISPQSGSKNTRAVDIVVQSSMHRLAPCWHASSAHTFDRRYFAFISILNAAPIDVRHTLIPSVIVPFAQRRLNSDRRRGPTGGTPFATR